MYDKEKINKFVKEYSNIIIYFIITVFLTFIFCVCYLYSFTFFEIVFTIEIIIFYLLGKYKESKIENKFLILAISLGIIYMFALPLGSVPDERNHFLRAYDISKGNIVTKIDEDGCSTTEYSKDINEVFKQKKYTNIWNAFKEKNEEVEKYSFKNTSLYSAICYIPQTIGILIGRILHGNIMTMAYLGRLFNFATYIILMYFAIKNLPTCKNVLMLIALLPITMQEAISLSADTLTIAICSFFIAYILMLVKNDKKQILTLNDYVIISVSTLLIAMCKIVYLPLVLLLFLIPKEKFEKNRITKIIIIEGIPIILSLIWMWIAKKYLTIEGTNSIGQVKFIIMHPFNYIFIMINSIYAKGNFYINTFLGQSLESFNINLNMIYSFITIVILTLVISKDNVGLEFSKKQKWIIVITLIITILAILTALYVQWTPLKKETIEGVQGRYFIPIFILLPVVLKKENTGLKLISNNYMYIMILLNLYALSQIILYHI